MNCKAASLQSLVLATALSLVAALSACSSSSPGSATPPTIKLSSTPSSLATGGTLQITATITNDTSGANWSASCGSTSASACGTFSSANTASGTAVTYTAPATIPPAGVVITATVADDSSVSASTAAITISSITVMLSTAPPASLKVSGTASIAATVANDTANAGVTWTVSCGISTACGSLNPTTSASAAATTYTAPASVPAGNTVTITAASVTDPSATASATIVITNPPSALTANSTYVFSLSGADANGFYSVAGAFTVGASGTITGGEQDFVDVSATSGAAEYFTDDISNTSSYAFSSDGNPIVTLVTCDGTNCTGTDTSVGVGGTETLDGTLLSSTSALISEFDTSATSTGTLDIQNNPSALSGGYEFFLSGEDPANDGPAELGGILNFDSGSLSTTNSVFDVNDFSFPSPYTDQVFSSGTVTPPDPFGRVQISLTPDLSNTSGVPGINLIAYEVDVNHLRFVETSDAYGIVTGGVALGQTGTFTNSSLSGTSYVFDAEGFDTMGPLQIAGVLTFTAASSSSTSGTVSGTLNYNDGALQNGQGGTAFSGTYTVDSTNPGRVSISGLNDSAEDFPSAYNLQLYLNGAGYGSLISVDAADTLAGRVYQQSGSYSAATFSGAYAVAAHQVVVSTGLPQDGVGPITADGIGVLAGFLDINESTPTVDVALSGNFVANSDGIFTGTITGLDTVTPATTNNFTFYFVDDTKAVAIETDATPDQLTLGYFSLQQ